MQVQNNFNYQIQNYNVQKRAQTPNFTAIEKIGYSGLYKNAPEEGQKLLEAFKQNPYAMDFCKKYNVKVFFHAMKEGYNLVESSIHIFYDNPTIGKVRKFFNALCNNEEQVKIHSFQTNLEECTNELVEMMLPEIEGSNKSGLLNSHIKLADEKMQAVVDAREAKKIVKQTEKQTDIDLKNKQLEARLNLDKLIEELISISKH